MLQVKNILFKEFANLPTNYSSSVQNNVRVYMSEYDNIVLRALCKTTVRNFLPVRNRRLLLRTMNEG